MFVDACTQSSVTFARNVLGAYRYLGVFSASCDRVLFPEDPSFNYTGSNTDTHNLVGTSGAYLADILLFLFGWVAYLPLGLIYGGLAALQEPGI